MAKDNMDSIWKGYTQEGLDMHAIKKKKTNMQKSKAYVVSSGL